MTPWEAGRSASPISSAPARDRRRGLPLLVVHEGGYRTRTLAANARGCFTGLARTVAQPPAPSAVRGRTVHRPSVAAPVPLFARNGNPAKK